jgi:ubiquinone/menaquinone biosynthesis C-methylase UbiE
MTGVRAALRRLFRVSPLDPRAAYRLWAATYDAQPDSVFLDIESRVFSALLDRLAVADRVVLDIGCGTGRHWPRLLAGHPRVLAGADNSPEMLDRLRAKHPGATLHLAEGTKLEGFDDATVDVIVSTLTLGHIAGIQAALAEWNRALRPGGAMLLTDFHPDAFRSGMKRTFRHGWRTIEVENHLHPVETLRSAFGALGLEVQAEREGRIDETVERQFQQQGGPEAYLRHRGTPVVIGFHLRKKSV